MPICRIPTQVYSSYSSPGRRLSRLQDYFLRCVCGPSYAHWLSYIFFTIGHGLFVHGQVTIIFVGFVCLSVCLFVCAEFFSAVFGPILIKLGYNYVICLALVVSLEHRGCATPGGWVTPKNLYFRGFGAQKTVSSYSFDRIVLIFGYIVERTNTKILSSHFFCNFHLEPKL